jgi:hypothetical protein
VTDFVPHQRVDDTQRRCAFRAERIAERHDDVADPHAVEISDRQRWELPLLALMTATAVPMSRPYPGSEHSAVV